MAAQPHVPVPKTYVEAREKLFNHPRLSGSKFRTLDPQEPARVAMRLAGVALKTNDTPAATNAEIKAIIEDAQRTLTLMDAQIGRARAGASTEYLHYLHDPEFVMVVKTMLAEVKILAKQIEIQFQKASAPQVDLKKHHPQETKHNALSDTPSNSNTVSSENSFDGLADANQRQIGKYSSALIKKLETSPLLETRIIKRTRNHFKFLRIPLKQNLSDARPYQLNQQSPSISVTRREFYLKNTTHLGLTLPPGFLPNSVQITNQDGLAVAFDTILKHDSSESYYLTFTEPIEGTFNLEILASEDPHTRYKVGDIEISEDAHQRMISRLRKENFSLLAQNVDDLQKFSYPKPSLHLWVSAIRASGFYPSEVKTSATYEHRPNPEKFPANYKHLLDNEGFICVQCSEASAFTHDLFVSLGEDHLKPSRESVINIGDNGVSTRADMHSIVGFYSDDSIIFFDSAPAMRNPVPEPKVSTQLRKRIFNPLITDNEQLQKSFLSWLKNPTKDNHPLVRGVLDEESFTILKKLRLTINDMRIVGSLFPRFSAERTLASTYAIHQNPLIEIAKIFYSLERRRPLKGTLPEHVVIAMAKARAAEGILSEHRLRLYYEDEEGNNPTSNKSKRSSDQRIGKNQNDELLKTLTTNFARGELVKHLKAISDIYLSIPESIRTRFTLHPVPSTILIAAKDPDEALDLIKLADVGTFLSDHLIELVHLAEKQEKQLRTLDYFKILYLKEWAKKRETNYLLWISMGWLPGSQDILSLLGELGINRWNLETYIKTSINFDVTALDLLYTKAFDDPSYWHRLEYQSEETSVPHLVDYLYQPTSICKKLLDYLKL